MIVSCVYRLHLELKGEAREVVVVVVIKEEEEEKGLIVG